jgi:hypothetical protein
VKAVPPARPFRGSAISCPTEPSNFLDTLKCQSRIRARPLRDHASRRESRSARINARPADSAAAGLLLNTGIGLPQRVHIRRGALESFRHQLTERSYVDQRFAVE